MFTSNERLEEIENKVFNRYYNNQYSRLAEPNKYAWFRKYHFNQTQATKVEYHVINNKKIYPKVYHKLYCYPVNIIDNYNKLRLFKHSELYGRLEPLQKYNNENIVNLLLFVNGELLDTNTRILITEKWLFVEFYDDNTNIDLDVISFNRAYTLVAKDEIHKHVLPKGINKENVLFFHNKKFTREFLVKNNKILHVFDLDEQDFVIYSPEIQILFFPDTGTIFNYMCDTSIVNMQNILIFSKNLKLNNRLPENNFSHVLCGIMKSNTPINGYIILFKTQSVGKQKVINTPLIEKYITHFDYNFDFIQNSLPYIIKNYTGVHLEPTNTFVDLINIDKDIYEEYLDGITTDTYTFTYNKLPEQFKNVKDNIRYIENLMQHKFFLKDFFMIAFPCKKYFNLFYNGKLMRDSAIHYIFNNRICYCFISKEKFTDYETAIIEVQVMDNLTNYIRYKKEIMENNTIIFGLQDYPIQDASDKNKLRVFLNGRLINPLDYRLVLKKNTLKYNYLVLTDRVNMGDIIVVECWDNQPVDVYNNNFINKNLLEINGLKYPLCTKYYDFYIQGIKYYDITRISNNKVTIDNCNDAYDVRVILKPEYNEIEPPYFNEYINAKDWWEVVLKFKKYSIINNKPIVNNSDNKWNNFKYNEKMISFNILYNLFLKYRHVVSDKIIQEEEILEYCSNLIEMRVDKEDIILIDANIEDQLSLYPIPATEEYYMNMILPDVIKNIKRKIIDANILDTPFEKFNEKSGYTKELHEEIFPSNVVLLDCNFEYDRNDFEKSMFIPNRDLIEGNDYRWIEYVNEREYTEKNGVAKLIVFPKDMKASIVGEMDFDGTLFGPPEVPKN